MSDTIDPTTPGAPDEPVATGIAESTQASDSLMNQELLALPEDIESTKFLNGLQSMKGLFQTRPEYNAMVCDELAKRGHAPNAKLVLNVGRWGNPASVGQDVKQWYAALAKRLSAEHARIPPAARLSANGLFEQLWMLAVQASAEPAIKEAQELKTHLDALRESTGEAIAEGERVIGQLNEDLDGLRAQLRTAEQHAEQSTARQITLGHEIDTLQRSIAQAAVDRKESERELKQKIEEQKTQSDRDRETTANAHASVVHSLQGMIAAERERFDAAGKAHALALDQFRQDVRSANERADQAGHAVNQARGVSDGLKDQLAMAAVEKARLEQRLSVSEALVADRDLVIAELNRQVTELTRSVQDVRAELAAEVAVSAEKAKKSKEPKI